MSLSDRKSRTGSWITDGLLALGVFLLAGLPRLLALDIFITADEIRWTCRSLNFRNALALGNLAETFQVGHPGVITMWLGGSTMPVSPTTEPARSCHNILLGQLVDQTSPEIMAQLGQLLFGARPVVALFTAAGIAGMALLTARLFDWRVGLLGGILVALDPFHLANSRVLHLDAVLTTLMTLSLLSLLVYLYRRPASRYLVLSGVFGGMAALNKSPGLFLAPLVALFVMGVSLRRRRPLWPTVRTIVIWGLVAGLTFVVLWPATWVDPVGTVMGVLNKATGYAADPHENSNFFWGTIRPDPGPAFYPVAWLFRTSPVVWLGLALTPLVVRRRKRSWGGALVALVAFGLLFTTFMTTGAKKFDRYLLPIFPALDIVAAAGLVGLVGLAVPALSPQPPGNPAAALSRRQSQRGLVAFLPVCLVLIVAQAIMVLPHHPYYFTYYNPLLGGTQKATDVLLVGWGEGLDQVGRYLNGKPDAETLQVATRNQSAFAPLFAGHIVDIGDVDPAQLDYYLFYLNQIQRNLDPEAIANHFRAQDAEFVAQLSGVEYAWLVPNDSYLGPLERIRGHAQPGDVVLAHAPSLFVEHYAAPVPLHTIEPGWDEAKVIDELTSVFEQTERVWYVRYGGLPRDLAHKIVDYELATHTLKLEEHTFPAVELRLYQRTDATAFGADSADNPMAVSFGDALALTGYGFAEPAAAWDKDLGLTLRWRALRSPDANYVVFLHLVDDQGRRWGQVDRWITDDRLAPTSLWQSGDEALDRYHLSLPAGIPPGRYHLRVGVYSSEDGHRLPHDQADAPSETAIALDVEVRPALVIPRPDDLELAHAVDGPLSDELRLLGYTLGTDRAAAGESLSVSLGWQALERPSADYEATLELRAPDGTRLGRTTSLVGSTQYPTSRWRAGEIIQNIVDLPVDRMAVAGDAELVVRLEPGDAVTLGHVAVDSPALGFTPPSDIQHPLPVTLGDRVKLLGYDLNRGPLRTGEDVRLTLYWQALGDMSVDYRAFVHLTDDQGQIHDQADGPPAEGLRPTSTWRPGEVFVDQRRVSATEAGIYRLFVGLYDFETGERLPAIDEAGNRFADDRIPLGRIEVAP